MYICIFLYGHVLFFSWIIWKWLQTYSNPLKYIGVYFLGKKIRKKNPSPFPLSPFCSRIRPTLTHCFGCISLVFFNQASSVSLLFSLWWVDISEEHLPLRSFVPLWGICSVCWPCSSRWDRVLWAGGLQVWGCVLGASNQRHQCVQCQWR